MPQFLQHGVHAGQSRSAALLATRAGCLDCPADPISLGEFADEDESIGNLPPAGHRNPVVPARSEDAQRQLLVRAATVVLLEKSHRLCLRAPKSDQRPM